VVALVAMLSVTVSAFAQTSQPISNETSMALVMAINDEYKTRATYQAVIGRCGPVALFTNIVRSEAAHIVALERLFDVCGLSVPPDTYEGKVQAPATLTEAAQIGIKAKKANVATYEGFLTFVQEPDVVAVFAQLKSASQVKHLPAWRRSLPRYEEFKKLDM
jgi:hypothetical protein